MLDTNICICIANQRPPEVKAGFSQLAAGEAAMSLVTYGELRFGAEKSDRSHFALRSLEDFVELVPVLPLERSAAYYYGKFRHDLQRQGLPIGSNDLWIASHCLDPGLTLATSNTGEFSRIPNLTIENWTN